MLGLNFRMTELEGAVLLAQLARSTASASTCAPSATSSGRSIVDLPGIGFRTLPDRDGDLATHLVVIFPDAELARAVTGELGSITLDHSGWHVYTHMEHLLARRTATGRGCPFDCACTHDEPAHYQAACCRRRTRCWPAR